MESKLLDFLRSNGTGVYEGFFRSSIFDKHILVNRVDIFFVGAKVITVFSKDEVCLGTHLLKVEGIDEEEGIVSCIIIHNDGDDTPYEPIQDYKDPVYIDLYPWEDDCAGRFIANFPIEDPKL